MKKIKAYAADSKDADLKLYEIERRATLEDDVGKILYILLYRGTRLLGKY